jgi:AraC-like DNA-binding protein
MNNEDFYWLIGLLEGEGSFGSGPPSAPSQCYISVQMTDKDIIKKVARLFNRSYWFCKSKNPKHKDSWITRLRAGDAAKLMENIKKHMSHRRQEQIERALQSRSKLKPSKDRISKEIKDIIKQRLLNGESPTKLSKEFNLSRPTIYRTIDPNYCRKFKNR